MWNFWEFYFLIWKFVSQPDPRHILQHFDIQFVPLIAPWLQGTKKSWSFRHEQSKHSTHAQFWAYILIRGDPKADISAY